MAKKDDALRKIAKDIEFLKESMITRLPEKIHRLEDENERLKLENNVLNDEKKLLIEANRNLEKRRGNNELLLKTIEDLKLNLASKQIVVAKLQQEIDALKENVVELKEKGVHFELDDKKKKSQLEIAIKRLKVELFKKHMLLGKFDETKKLLEQQVYALARQKEKLEQENSAAASKLKSLISIIKRQEAVSGAVRNECSQRILSNKQRYEEIIRRLNENNMHEVIDKNASVAAMEKNLRQMQHILALKDEKQKRMLQEFENLIRKEAEK